MLIPLEWGLLHSQLDALEKRERERGNEWGRQGHSISLNCFPEGFKMLRWWFNHHATISN